MPQCNPLAVKDPQLIKVPSTEEPNCSSESKQHVQIQKTCDNLNAFNLIHFDIWDWRQINNERGGHEPRSGEVIRGETVPRFYRFCKTSVLQLCRNIIVKI